jgi:hypothetical protein
MWFVLGSVFVARAWNPDPQKGEDTGMRNARLAVSSAAIGFVAAFAAGPSMPAAVNLSKGQSALFNFDFTAVAPAPSYEVLYFVWQWRDNTSDKAQTDYFGALNGSSLLYSDYNGPDVFAVAVAWFDPNYPGLRDGLFSVRITSTLGTFSVDPYAYGLKGWVDETPHVYGVHVPGSSPPPGGEAAVPVPATLPLLLPGLAGIGFLAHRWKEFTL